MASKNSTLLNSIGNSQEWTSPEGISKPLEGYSEEFMTQLYKQIKIWQDHDEVPDPFTHNSAPSDVLTDNQMDYVYSHMENTIESLTRIETLGVSISEDDLKIGKHVQFNKPLKAFSETEKATEEYMRTFETGEQLVLFKVKGNPSFFRMNSWTKRMENEEEVWLDTRKQYKITNIQEIEYPSLDNPTLQGHLEEYFGRDLNYHVKYVELE